MYQTGTHGSVGGRLANQSSASYPIKKNAAFRQLFTDSRIDMKETAHGSFKK